MSSYRKDLRSPVYADWSNCVDETPNGLFLSLAGLNETEITHLVTTLELVPKVLSFLELVPSITTIIYMECPYKKESKPSAPEKVRLIPFSQLEALGRAADPSLVSE